MIDDTKPSEELYVTFSSSPFIHRDVGKDNTVEDLLKDLCSRCYRPLAECKCDQCNVVISSIHTGSFLHGNSFIETKTQEEEHRRLALEALQEHYCMNCFRRLPKHDELDKQVDEEKEEICTCSEVERAGVAYNDIQKKPVPSVG